MKQYYTFDDSQQGIRFDRFDLPSPWINYLSNGRMHAFVSQAGGGMTWWLTPMLFRVSRYRFYHLPIDSPGFYVYIRMNDGIVWSPTFRPCETKVDHREAAHHPGYSVFTAEKDGLVAKLTLFMAQDSDTLIWEVTLRNTKGEAVACDVFAYVELSQFMAQQENILGYYLKWNTRAIYDQELQAITYAYTAWMHPRKERQQQAMDSASRELDTGMGLLLNTPGYPGWPSKEAAMVNGLPAGYSENGGVFCQANCWAIMAEALLGRGDMAWKYYKQILPHSVIKKIGVERYHSEAYAYCSTMLGKDNEKFGWGCVSQVTGTAAWMDVVSTQYLLGVRPTLKGLLIDPAIPAQWDGYTVERLYRGCKLTIQVENPAHVQHGVKSMTVNGKKVNGAYITEELLGSCNGAQVHIVMG